MTELGDKINEHHFVFQHYLLVAKGVGLSHFATCMNTRSFLNVISIDTIISFAINSKLYLAVGVDSVGVESV